MTEPFTLEKSLWTESDFETMGWHDATVHAIVFPGGFEIAFGIDDILRWVPPTAGQEHFSFWVAPATLVFWNLHGLYVELEQATELDLTVLEIKRSDAGRPLNAEYVGRDVEWHWMIDCDQGEIAFRSCGFHQHFRAVPTYGWRQRLPMDERGGYSIERPGEWLSRGLQG